MTRATVLVPLGADAERFLDAEHAYMGAGHAYMGAGHAYMSAGHAYMSAGHACLVAHSRRAGHRREASVSVARGGRPASGAVARRSSPSRQMALTCSPGACLDSRLPRMSAKKPAR
jgi:hypothetical protein